MRLLGVCVADLPRHVDGAHPNLIEQLDARHLHALVEQLDDRLHRGVHVLERGRRDFDGQLGREPHSALGDDAQCPFGADEELRRVVAHGAFPGARARLDDFACR